MNRNPNSHKGDNGKVMVIGGSEVFYGAPILAALGAEYSGVDLIFPVIPRIHLEAAKTHSLNFILNTFEQNHFSQKDVNNLLNFSEKVDAVVVGPGLGEKVETKEALKDLLKGLKVPVVIDASALIYTNMIPKKAVLTPHRGEFKELTGDDPTPENVQKWAKDMQTVICCKGPKDIIANEDELVINDTGNAMMTVGGSGDVLAGLIGGLMAQGMTPFEAAVDGTRILGKVAEGLASIQGNVRAVELARGIPSVRI